MSYLDVTKVYLILAIWSSKDYALMDSYGSWGLAVAKGWQVKNSR